MSINVILHRDLWYAQDKGNWDKLPVVYIPGKDHIFYFIGETVGENRIITCYKYSPTLNLVLDSKVYQTVSPGSFYDPHGIDKVPLLGDYLIFKDFSTRKFCKVEFDEENGISNSPNKIPLFDHPSDWSEYNILLDTFKNLIIVGHRNTPRFYISDADGNILGNFGGIGTGPLEFLDAGHPFYDSQRDVLWIPSPLENKIKVIHIDSLFPFSISSVSVINVGFPVTNVQVSSNILIAGGWDWGKRVYKINSDYSLTLLEGVSVAGSASWGTYEGATDIFLSGRVGGYYHAIEYVEVINSNFETYLSEDIDIDFYADSGASAELEIPIELLIEGVYLSNGISFYIVEAIALSDEGVFNSGFEFDLESKCGVCGLDESISFEISTGFDTFNENITFELSIGADYLSKNISFYIEGEGYSDTPAKLESEIIFELLIHISEGLEGDATLSGFISSGEVGLGIKVEGNLEFPEIYADSVSGCIAIAELLEFTLEGDAYVNSCAEGALLLSDIWAYSNYISESAAYGELNLLDISISSEGAEVKLGSADGIVDNVRIYGSGYVFPNITDVTISLDEMYLEGAIIVVPYAIFDGRLGVLSIVTTAEIIKDKLEFYENGSPKPNPKLVYYEISVPTLEE